MGELITSQTLNPTPVQTIPAGTPIQMPNSGFNIDMKDIKEIFNLVNEGIKNFKEIQQMRQQFTNTMQPQQPQIANLGIDPEKPAPLNTVVKEAQPMKTKINREKLKTLLNDIMTTQAQKLPTDIKEKQLKEFIGENWTNFTYKYAGVMTITSEDLLDTITRQLADQLETMLEATK